MRKIYRVNQDDYEIPLEWFSDNMMSASSFKTWKKTMKNVKTVASLKKDERSKIFYELHSYKQY